jgi:hypothetical protein
LNRGFGCLIGSFAVCIFRLLQLVAWGWLDADSLFQGFYQTPKIPIYQADYADIW